MSVSALEIKVGKRLYRICGDRVWVQGFGTTGPNQTPHYSWLTIKAGSASYKEAKNAVRSLCGSGR
jgi:hypothetical protein